MKVIIKCIVPDWSEITHAIVDFDRELINWLKEKMGVVREAKNLEPSLLRMVYDVMRVLWEAPCWIDLGDPVDHGLSEDFYDAEFNFAPKEFAINGESMCSVFLNICEDSFWWSAIPKHCGAESRVETCTISFTELQEIEEKLNEVLR